VLERASQTAPQEHLVVVERFLGHQPLVLLDQQLVVDEDLLAVQ